MALDVLTLQEVSELNQALLVTLNDVLPGRVDPARAVRGTHPKLGPLVGSDHRGFLARFGL